MNTEAKKENRVVCQYNLRGMCIFGTRCRNLHVIPEESKKEKSARSTGNGRQYLQGLGPSTSTAKEAVELVRKAQSADKSCGICLEVIMEKANPVERTFGILSSCCHCFCFPCIRTWRQSYFDDVAKACPECRVTSEFVYPSKYWLESKEKAEFVGAQKRNMKERHCRYFKQGKGKCHFGNTCMCLHALPNGQLVDLGPPLPRPPRPVDELIRQIMLLQIDNDLIEADQVVEDEFEEDEEETNEVEADEVEADQSD